MKDWRNVALAVMGAFIALMVIAWFIDWRVSRTPAGALAQQADNFQRAVAKDFEAFQRQLNELRAAVPTPVPTATR